MANRHGARRQLRFSCRESPGAGFLAGAYPAENRNLNLWSARQALRWLGSDLAQLWSQCPVFGEVLAEAAGEFARPVVVCVGVAPRRPGVEHPGRNVRALFRHLQPEDRIDPARNRFQPAVENRRDDGARIGDADALSLSPGSPAPTSVDEPAARPVPAEALAELARVPGTALRNRGRRSPTAR